MKTANLWNIFIVVYVENGLKIFPRATGGNIYMLKDNITKNKLMIKNNEMFCFKFVLSSRG